MSEGYKVSDEDEVLEMSERELAWMNAARASRPTPEQDEAGKARMRDIAKESSKDCSERIQNIMEIREGSKPNP